MVRNGIFWTIGEQSYIVYYPIISYRRIKVYRVETMDMERSHLNNGVIGAFLISIITTLLIDTINVPMKPFSPWDLTISIFLTL